MKTGNSPNMVAEVPEIEVTPEMIEAGEAAYWNHRDHFPGDGQIEEGDVEAIFQAMKRAELSRSVS